MSRTRANDRLSEIDERAVAAAEADLNRLLAIEPSPEFAAKVRARIREPQKARGWSTGWLGLALASAAALFVAMGDPAGWRVPKSAPVPVETTVTSVGRGLKAAPPTAGLATAPTAVTVETAPTAVARKTAPTAVALKTAPDPTGRNRSGQPVVLIDPSLGQAIRRLSLSTANLALDPTMPDGSAAPAFDAPVPSVVVEPLEVPELVLKPADRTSGG